MVTDNIFIGFESLRYLYVLSFTPFKKVGLLSLVGSLATSLRFFEEPTSGLIDLLSYL